MKKSGIAGYVTTIIGFAVAALFVIFGSYLTFSDAFEYVPDSFRNIFGIVLICYGLFRAAIIFQKLREREIEEEEQ